MNSERAARAWPYAAVAAVAALVFARGPFSGNPFYFRDLSLQFLPLRRFVLDGLRGGSLHYWNPYAHEGEPLALPPISYPFDLLQLLRPDEAGISFVLALHIPLAAVWMMALARKGLGLSATAAAGAGLVYALGGFALSTINLYVYTQALAWAPAVILGLLAAARGGARAVALGAVSVAILVSTTAAEMVVQAILIATILALPCAAAGMVRMGAVIVLGAALAAPSIAVISHVAADSARASGLPPEVVLAHSVHPLTLAQVVVAGFYGDPAHLTDRWWGGNFFPRGFPYILSLYLGLTTLVIAAVGAASDRGPRRRLLAIALAAVLVALGRWGLGGFFIEAFELARIFRYPSKVFFAVHLAVALLAGLGLDALARGARGSWRALTVGAALAGSFVVSAPFWPAVAPGRARWFAAGFFPPEHPWPVRLGLLDWILRDAAVGAAVTLAAAGVGVLAWRGRLVPQRAALALVALATADLFRAGAGLNPATSPAFFAPSPEVARHHATWRAGGRVFTCAPASSAAYARGRALRADHERWTFAVLRDTTVPFFNLRAGVRSALSPDTTMLVPPARLIDVDDAACRSPERLIGPLRLAGVAHVLSLDPIAHGEFRLQAAEQPEALVPVTVHAYALAGPLPRISLAGAIFPAASVAEARTRAAGPAFDPRFATVIEGAGLPPSSADGSVTLRRDDPGHIAIDVSTRAPAVVVIREAHGPGWTASVDGVSALLLRANGRHMAVSVPAGTHRVALDYAPPGLRAGLLIALASVLAIVALAAASFRHA